LGESVNVADMEKSAPAPDAGSRVVSLLRNPSSVRTAIVVNEILGPPKGLRRR
jgi:hypothetical protein